jgi:hypothetical protein
LLSISIEIGYLDQRNARGGRREAAEGREEFHASMGREFASNITYCFGQTALIRVELKRPESL